MPHVRLSTLAANFADPDISSPHLPARSRPSPSSCLAFRGRGLPYSPARHPRASPANMAMTLGAHGSGAATGRPAGQPLTSLAPASGSPGAFPLARRPLSVAPGEAEAP